MEGRWTFNLVNCCDNCILKLLKMIITRAGWQLHISFTLVFANLFKFSYFIEYVKVLYYSLIFISLMTRDIDHLFMCLLVICVSAFINLLYKYISFLKYEFCFFTVYVFYIFWTWWFCKCNFANMFSLWLV